MTANKQMTGEQLDELMTVAVNMQRDSEKAGDRPSAMFAYAVQVAVIELRKVRNDAAELEQQLAESHRALRAETTAHENLQMQVEKLAAENAGLNNFIAASCFVYAGELGYWPAIDHSPETPATNQLSIAESQFLTDVMTAAGLLSCGKRDKQLAQRLADFCVSKRGGSNAAQLRKGVQS
ncbi:hypothetical protein [Enterobacter cloacae]|uniref:hypothetical protein n=1 Tax=Enterobacter cloacae TaxID=550 RepID=UPI00101B0D42|nr:hypothetical protein [Enterobacter cloacae]QBC01886.1 hypothetical protein EWI30_07285 [Enterobacter cloacae]